MSAPYVTRISADHPCLAGHFPGNPIVPAVVMLDCVQDALRAQQGANHITRIAHVKFLAPLKPEEELRITLELEAQIARFRCESGSRLLAQGSLEFAVET